MSNLGHGQGWKENKEGRKERGHRETAVIHKGGEERGGMKEGSGERKREIGMSEGEKKDGRGKEVGGKK